MNFILGIIYMYAFFLVYLIIQLVLYAIESIGIFRLALRNKNKFPYLAFIPGINQYFLGKYTFSSHFGIILAILSVIKLIGFIFIWGTKFLNLDTLYLYYSVFYLCINIILMHKFYQKKYIKSYVFTILTILTLGYSKPIFIYISDNSKTIR